MHHPLRIATSVALNLALSLALAVPFPFAARRKRRRGANRPRHSAEDAAMEGVLVSATKAGSNITVTVVTGAEGRYAFPASRLGPGRYTLAVRAVGYQLDPSRKTKT